MAGKKNTTTTRGGKRGAKPEDEDEEEVEDVEDAQEVEDPQRGEPRDDDDDANDGNVDGEEDVEDAEDGEGGDGMEDRDDGGATAGRIPRDAAVVRDILKSMGVTDAERRVIHQGMEFVHRYASEALEEAAVAARHAGRTKINVDDVKMGTKALLLTQFVDPPSLAEAQAMANAVNKNPLPKLVDRPGIHVPTERNLLSDNWDIGPPPPNALAAEEAEREAEAQAQAAAAAAAAAVAIAKAAEPSAMGDDRAPVSFDVKKATATDVAMDDAADLGEFAEFMDDDDDE